MSFQPSTRSYGYLGDAGGAGATSRATSVSLTDVNGTGPFVVHSDGRVVYRGTTWQPNVGNWDLVISNLSDVPGNKAKIESVLGTMTVQSAITSAQGKPQPDVSSSVSPKDALVPAPAPKMPWNHWWFWPVVIGQAALLAAGGIWYFYGTEKGQSKVRSLKGAVANTSSLVASAATTVRARANPSTLLWVGGVALVGVSALGVGLYMGRKTSASPSGTNRKRRKKGSVVVDAEQAANIIFDWVSEQSWASEGGVAISAPESQGNGSWTATAEVGENVVYVTLRPDGSVEHRFGT